MNDIIAQIETLLTNLAPGATLDLEIHKTTEGTLILRPQPASKEELLAEKYGHLRANELSLTQAAQKYDVPRGTIENWIYRAKYLQFSTETTHPKLINEAEMAYLAELYHQRLTTGSKAPLLDDNGLPYEVKYPELAATRRKRRTRSR
jgi:transposase